MRNTNQKPVAFRIISVTTGKPMTEWIDGDPGVEPSAFTASTPLCEQGKIQLAFENYIQPQHPDDDAVDAFAFAMKAKLAKKRAEGRSGWNTPKCTQELLTTMLCDHVAKGDPIDVANIAMMLHQRGEGIAVAQPSDTEKDAARYRWLRDFHIGNDPESINLKPGYQSDLDASIDAAIQAQEQPCAQTGRGND